MHYRGITRRIDELGRIVVPKEIRYNLGIRDGEQLEILVENSEIKIRKYSQIENIGEYSEKIANIFSDICNVNIIISDREKVIATNNLLNHLKNNKIDSFQKKLIDNRESYNGIIEERKFDINGYFIIIPIITSMDCSGLVIINSKTSNVNNIIYAKLIQKLLVKKLEVD